MNKRKEGIEAMGRAHAERRTRKGIQKTSALRELLLFAAPTLLIPLAIWKLDL